MTEIRIRTAYESSFLPLSIQFALARTDLAQNAMGNLDMQGFFHGGAKAVESRMSERRSRQLSQSRTASR
ncbi:MAG: hypothetical protein RLZZ386_1190 [Planctomycetota bacterium]